MLLTMFKNTQHRKSLRKETFLYVIDSAHKSFFPIIKQFCHFLTQRSQAESSQKCEVWLRVTKYANSKTCKQ